MRHATLASIFVLAATLAFGPLVHAGVGPPAPNSFWVDGSMYATVGTPTSLPNHGPKDGIYVFTNLDGQKPVAEAKPGDHDYNGGRWQVTLLEYTEEGLNHFDADDDGVADFELTSWEMVQDSMGMGYLVVAGQGPSFVCPVIRNR
jgi:hypothetical protein